MDYVARAKNLMGSKTRTACLLILPLGAVIQSQAASISVVTQDFSLPTTNLVCKATDDLGPRNCASPGVSALSPINGIQGLKFFGPSSGGSYSFSIGEGGVGDLTFGTSGPLGGPSGGSIAMGTVIPIHYAFNINPTDGTTLSGWTLTFRITQLGVDSTVTTNNPSGSFTGLETGNAALTLASTLLAGQSTTVVADLHFTGSSGGSVLVSVPQNSFDFNSTTAVPEPATAGLGSLGIALAGAWRLLIKRRKKRLELLSENV